MAFQVLCLLAIGATALKQSRDMIKTGANLHDHDDTDHVNATATPAPDHSHLPGVDDSMPYPLHPEDMNPMASPEAIEEAGAGLMDQAIGAEEKAEKADPLEALDHELEKAETDPLFQAKNPLLDTFKKRMAAKATAEKNPNNPVATLDTTVGVIEVELYLNKAPITVSNFIDLARQGFYDGLHFHRVIPVFMAQFGCPFSKNPKDERAGTGGPPPHTTFANLGGGKAIERDANGNIPDECPGVSNEAGTISMANTGAPQSGGSQFFLNMANNENLDCFSEDTPSAHPVFGRITKGYRIAAEISRTPTKDDKPIKPIMMKSITISGLAHPPVLTPLNAVAKTHPQASFRSRTPAKTPAKTPARRSGGAKLKVKK